MEQATVFLHSGSVGDTWASLPALREHYRQTGRKAFLYLENGRKAFYYEGATHPTLNEKGAQVMLNKQMIEMMLPLLKEQEFILGAKEWNKEMIHFDLNNIRETNVGMPNFCLSRWYFYIFPDLACDLTQTWLTVPDTDQDFAKDKIVITRTERYTNPNINYSFLAPHQKDLLFVGTELEYNIFKYRFKLYDLQRLEINNFLELAQALKQCKFHISNQTQAFQLSQGMKIPRMVELCTFAPNVIVIGENAYDFLAQEGCEYNFHKLNGTVEPFLKAQRDKQFLLHIQ